MGIIAWIIFGALAGWVAGLITRSGRRGCITNIIIGIVGAFIGGVIMEFLTGTGFSMGFNLRSFIVAVIGSIILLALVGASRKKKR